MTRVVGLLALPVLAITTLVLLSTHWYLVCGDQQGIDCFDENVLPSTHSTPARWLGFLPLTVAWLAAAVALATCIAIEYRRRRSPANRAQPIA